MFKRKECPRCGKKTNSNNDFCPSCGISLKENTNKGDFGMLGENDFFNENIQENPFNMIGGGMLGKMLGSAMKMLEKELQKSQKQNVKSVPMSNIELFINGKKISPRNIKVSKKSPDQEEKQETKKAIPTLEFDSAKTKQFAKLKKKEPSTNVRRFSNKVVYEVKMPGVKSLDDISLIQLESSIEIKSIGRDKAYKKVIAVNLPIMDYSLSKGIFKLDLEAKN
jgi:hypothetical protein